MECKEFRDWLSESRLADVQESQSIAAHYESCEPCREAVDEEREWHELFALIPARVPQRSLWPQIAHAIREQSLKLSMSDALLLFSQRLAPAFAILLLVLGALFVWSAPETAADGDAMIAMLQTDATGLIEEPDAILIAWAEASPK